MWWPAGHLIGWEHTFIHQAADFLRAIARDEPLRCDRQFAVKELAERGLNVLLLEVGRDITDADFTPPPETQPRAMGTGLGPRVRAAL